MTPEEIEDRRNYLGGSELSVIHNINNYQSPFMLWEVKKGLKPSDGHNIMKEKGHRLEPVVCEWFQDEIILEEGKENWKIVEDLDSEGLQNHYSDGYKRCTLDRLIVQEGKVIGFLEAKSANESKRDSWNGTIPKEYMMQIQWYMGITGYDICYIAVLIGGWDFRYVQIPKDEEMIKNLYLFSDSWWQKHIIDGVQPDFTELDNKMLDKTKTIEKLPISLPSEAASYAARLIWLNEEIKLLGKEKRDIQAYLKGLMGDFKRGTLPGFRVNWSTFTKPGFWVKEQQSSLFTVITDDNI